MNSSPRWVLTSRKMSLVWALKVYIVRRGNGQHIMSSKEFAELRSVKLDFKSYRFAGELLGNAMGIHMVENESAFLGNPKKRAGWITYHYAFHYRKNNKRYLPYVGQRLLDETK